MRDVDRDYWLRERREKSAPVSTSLGSERKVNSLGALHLRTALLFILIHRILPSAPRPPLIGIDHLDVLIQVNLLGVGGKGSAGGEDRLERGERFGVEGIGEGDVDLDDEVAHLVVAVRRHALVGEDLERSCEEKGTKVSSASRDERAEWTNQA